MLTRNISGKQICQQAHAILEIREEMKLPNSVVEVVDQGNNTFKYLKSFRKTSNFSCFTRKSTCN